jgi:hypothetical protein
MIARAPVEDILKIISAFATDSPSAVILAKLDSQS